MNKALILAAVALCAAPAAAADSGHCDAKPFMLNKPANQAKKAAEQPKLAQTAPATAKRAAKSKPKAKPPLLAGCKSGRAKKSG